MAVDRVVLRLDLAARVVAVVAGDDQELAHLRDGQVRAVRVGVAAGELLARPSKGNRQRSAGCEGSTTGARAPCRATAAGVVGAGAPAGMGSVVGARRVSRHRSTAA